jgi:hypothetical protein
MSQRMPLIYNDPTHWRARAMEARTIADRMRDPEGRYRMLTIAKRYNEIAERAVERLKALARGTRPIVPDDGDID